MGHFSFHFDEQKTRRRTVISAVGYWLAVALLLAVLAFGIHRYFEYRDRELDKKLERLGFDPTPTPPPMGGAFESIFQSKK